MQAATKHFSLQTRCLVAIACLYFFSALNPVLAEEVDPTQPGARVVQIEPEKSLDIPAPVSEFIVPNGEEMWKRVMARATTVVVDRGGGFFDATALVGEGFRTAKRFQSEKY